MSELGAAKTRELFAGTWINLALIAEIVIQANLVRRADLALFLSDAEAKATDQRRIAFRALRLLIERGNAGPLASIPRCRRNVSWPAS